MTPVEFVVTAAGVALMGWIVWYFWLHKDEV